MKFVLTTGESTPLATAESLVWLNFAAIRAWTMGGALYFPPVWRVLANGRVIAEVITKRGAEGSQMDSVRRVLIDREKRGCYRGKFSVPPLVRGRYV